MAVGGGGPIGGWQPTMSQNSRSHTDPLQAIYDAIAEDDRDWSEDERSAVIYAIVCGWHELLPEVALKYDWSDEKIVRLTYLRSRFRELCPGAAPK